MISLVHLKVLWDSLEMYRGGRHLYRCIQLSSHLRCMQISDNCLRKKCPLEGACSLTLEQTRAKGKGQLLTRNSTFLPNSGHSVSRPGMLPMAYWVGLFRISPALPLSLCSNMKITACRSSQSSHDTQYRNITMPAIETLANRVIAWCTGYASASASCLQEQSRLP